MTDSAFESFVRITAVDVDEPIDTSDDFLADYLASAVLEELNDQAEKSGAACENDGMILTLNGSFDLSGIVSAVIRELKSVSASAATA